MASYWAAISTSLESITRPPPGRPRHRPRRPPRSRPRPGPRPPSSGRHARTALPSGISFPSATRACWSETIATSIMSSVGWLVVIIWTQIPGDHSQRTRAWSRWRAPSWSDLVADGGDDRDQDDARHDQPHRRQLADDGEGQDRDDQDDDQELGAAARMRGGVLAGRRDGQRVAGLEGVDRHVLGAVVLERAPHVRRPRHQQQIAEEDDDLDHALGELQPEALVHAPDGRLGEEERQQEEDPDAESQRDNEHAADRDGVALAEAFLCTGRLGPGGLGVRIRVARRRRSAASAEPGVSSDAAPRIGTSGSRTIESQQRPGRAAGSPGRAGHASRPVAPFRSASSAARPGEWRSERASASRSRACRRGRRARERTAGASPGGRAAPDRAVRWPRRSNRRVAQGDRECIAAAHQDAFDERLAAVVEACHGGSLAEQP